MAESARYVVDVKIDKIITLVLAAEKTGSLEAIRSKFGDVILSVDLSTATAIKDLARGSGAKPFAMAMPDDFGHCTRRLAI
jgi:hypothetical protein